MNIERQAEFPHETECSLWLLMQSLQLLYENIWITGYGCIGQMGSDQDQHLGDS